MWGVFFMLKNKSQKVTDVYEAFILDRKSRRFKSGTLQTYKDRILPFVNWCDSNTVFCLSDITPTVIRTYLTQLQDKNLASQTIHGIAIAIQSFFNWLVKEELLKESPMRKVAIPKAEKKILPAFTQEDIQKLLKNTNTERDEAIILFLLDSGARATELLNLTGGDIDMKTGIVTIRQGKGSKDRIVYIGNKTRKQLLRYYMERGTPKENEKVWLSETKGTPLTNTGLSQFLKKLGIRIGVKNCSPHTFRRTFALNSLRNGMSIYHLQRLMGHEDITVLKQYLALSQNDLQAAHVQHGVVDNL